MPIFNRVQPVHRRVTGFCAAGEVNFAQIPSGAHVFAVLDKNGAGITDFRGPSRL